MEQPESSSPIGSRVQTPLKEQTTLEKSGELNKQIAPPTDIPLTKEDEAKINALLKEQTTLEKSGELNKQIAPPADISLTKEDQAKVDTLLREIDDRYREIPSRRLGALPDVQEKCLSLLLEAENALSKRPLERKDIITARLALTRVHIQLATATASQTSFAVPAGIIYIIAILVFLGIQFGWFNLMNMDKPVLVVGIPLPIWMWSVIGSFTSMLLRAGQLPFADSFEAIRWLCYRPIVGVVMGLMTYLMVVTGLLVFTGGANPKSPELLWVIAFLGSFSDTLSINLLQRLLGQFQVTGEDSKKPQDNVKTSTGKSQG
jgi:hypothetical protein